MAYYLFGRERALAIPKELDKYVFYNCRVSPQQARCFALPQSIQKATRSAPCIPCKAGLKLTVLNSLAKPSHRTPKGLFTPVYACENALHYRREMQSIFGPETKR